MYFIFSVIKYFLINFGILNINSAIHKDMIHGLLRSNSSSFDSTPSGQFNNKFSNDLGIMDNVLFNVLIDSI
jgi:ABC-type multidrug transport system fused ATPase/permease subunit